MRRQTMNSMRFLLLILSLVGLSAARADAGPMYSVTDLGPAKWNPDYDPTGRVGAARFDAAGQITYGWDGQNTPYSGPLPPPYTISQKDSFTARIMFSTGPYVTGIFASLQTGIHVFVSDGTIAARLPGDLPTDVNQLGQVLTIDGMRSWLYDFQDGSVTPIHDLLGLSWDNTALGLNDLGQIVGRSRLGDVPSPFHAYLTDGTTTLDLNNLIPSGTGWTLLAATDIDNAGRILGEGTDPSGHLHYFELTPAIPTPEPSSLCLFGVAVCALLARRMARRAWKWGQAPVADSGASPHFQAQDPLG